jgi:hypothetical protein
MIELDEFEFSAKDYYRIVFWQLAVHYFRTWAYLTVFLLAIYVVVLDELFFPICVSTVLAVSLLIITYFTARFYAYSKTSNAILQKRKMSFGDGMCNLTCKDGTESRGPLNHFHGASIFYGHYCLFMHGGQYYPIPFAAFRSEEDRTKFETEILGGKLKTKSIPWKQIAVFLLFSVCMFGAAYAFRVNIDPDNGACCIIERVVTAFQS